MNSETYQWKALADLNAQIQAELRVMGDRITKVEQRLTDSMLQEPELGQQYDKEQDLGAIRKERDYWKEQARELNEKLDAQTKQIGYRDELRRYWEDRAYAAEKRLRDIGKILGGDNGLE